MKRRWTKGIAVVVAATVLATLQAVPAHAAGAIDVFPGVNLRTYLGYWVSAEPSGRVIADRVDRGSWETFTMLEFNRTGPYDNGDFVLVTAHNTCVTFEPGGLVVANRTKIGPWEKFHMTNYTDPYGAIFALSNNRYVAAEGGGGRELVANRTAFGPWETFAYRIPSRTQRFHDDSCTP